MIEQFTHKLVVNGETYTMTQDMTDVVTGDWLEEIISPAKAGVLTVRTDFNTGSLTMASGHGIGTGNRLDVHWVDADGINRHRRGMVVGTVASLVVPIDGGTGDNLPAAASVIAAMVPVPIPISTDATNWSIFGVKVEPVAGSGSVTAKGVAFSLGVTSGSYTEGGFVLLNGTIYTGTEANWQETLSGTNPLEPAGGITNTFVSHGDVSKSVKFRFDVGVAA